MNGVAVLKAKSFNSKYHLNIYQHFQQQHQQRCVTCKREDERWKPTTRHLAMQRKFQWRLHSDFLMDLKPEANTTATPHNPLRSASNEATIVSYHPG
jgi:hypothetical protein